MTADPPRTSLLNPNPPTENSFDWQIVIGVPRGGVTGHAVKHADDRQLD
jgi:hypothetical protein